MPDTPQLPDEVRRMIGKAARGYLAEMRGEFCQCAEPDIEGRKASLCFRCGLVNQDAKSRVGEAMREPHPFEPMGEGPIRQRYCGFCSYPKEDARHG